ncbi:MAG: phage major capsid protein [Rhizobiaceae bacterium]|nr:phage major capsid protein [Rhizobiaceae bacterium]
METKIIQSENMETKAVETKATGNEVANAFEDFMRAFESYKETNDERLAQVEQRMDADIVTTEKMARISSAMDDQKRKLDQLMVKGSRPVLGAKSSAPIDDEHRTAFDAYMRRGEEFRLRQVEQKAMSQSSDPDGGYLVPDELDQQIGRRLSDLSPIRSISSVRQVTGSVLKKPFSQNGMAVGWVGETDARPQTTNAQLVELQFPTMELYAMPAATSSLLEDSAIDIDTWIMSEIEAAFAEQEGAAFVAGDGVNKPSGFLNAPQVDDASWSWGNLGYIATGTDGGFGDDPSDRLIDVIYALKSGYRQNAKFVMNRQTQGTIRQFKDADGNYMWQPPAAPGQQAMLNGFPVVEAEDMPDISSDSMSIAFGDFERGYLVVDRQGVSVLRDPYSAKPYVLFYTTKRVGGGVQNYEALKLIKFGSS